MQKRLENQLAKTEFAAKKVKVKSVKGAKKAVKVNWNKVESADGYVIEYAKKANFKGKKGPLRLLLIRKQERSRNFLQRKRTM